MIIVAQVMMNESSRNIPEESISRSVIGSSHADADVRQQPTKIVVETPVVTPIRPFTPPVPVEEEKKEAASPNENLLKGESIGATNHHAGQPNITTSNNNKKKEDVSKKCVPPALKDNIQLVVHPPPPRRLCRHQSEPVSKSSKERRSIFGRYWGRPGEEEEEAEAVEEQSTQTPTARRRSASISTLPLDKPAISSSPTATTNNNGKNLCIEQFSPPKDRPLLVNINRGHFKLVEELPQDCSALLSERTLPDLPFPLQRYYSSAEGKRTPLPGMYPLRKQKPILRQSSYGNQTSADASNSGTPQGVNNSADVDNGKLSFNLTKTVRRFHSTEEITTESSSHSSSASAATSSASTQRKVCFDPRVTVTEFGDDDVKREWFTEAELQRFQVEAIVLAQKYLLKHPEMVELYNKPRLDPVTGTMRKKALYSIPVLSSEEDANIERSAAMAADTYCCYRKEMTDLVHQEVKKILVVDPNKLILDLFAKSLQLIFPKAKITAVKTAEEAFDIFREALLQSPVHRGYDLVIAEERLHRPLAAVTRSLSSEAAPALPKSGKSCNQLQNLSTTGMGQENNTEAEKHVVVVRTHGSLSNLAEFADKSKNCMTGSELLQKISSLEDSVWNSLESLSFQAGAASSGSAVASSLSPVQWRSLLIGVSAYPDQDSPVFYNKGADLVWGKPPPRMDLELRDLLVAKLVMKRRDKSQKDASIASESDQDS